MGAETEAGPYSPGEVAEEGELLPPVPGCLARVNPGQGELSPRQFRNIP